MGEFLSNIGPQTKTIGHIPLSFKMGFAEQRNLHLVTILFPCHPEKESPGFFLHIITDSLANSSLLTPSHVGTGAVSVITEPMG